MEQKTETTNESKQGSSKEEKLESIVKNESDSSKLVFIHAQDDLEPEHLFEIIDSINDDLYRMDAIISTPKLSRDQKVKLSENFKHATYAQETLNRI